MGPFLGPVRVSEGSYGTTGGPGSVRTSPDKVSRPSLGTPVATHDLDRPFLLKSDGEGAETETGSRSHPTPGSLPRGTGWNE